MRFWWLKAVAVSRYHQCRDLSDWCVACTCICVTFLLVMAVFQKGWISSLPPTLKNGTLLVVQPTLPLADNFYRYYGCLSLLLLDNEQAIVQRCLGAKDLASGQKGILTAALFLLTLPIILNLPGLLSFHILGEGLNQLIPLIHYWLIKWCRLHCKASLLPHLFGAILSTFNSFLNSAATIYCKDLLPSISKTTYRSQSWSSMEKVSTIMAIVTMIIGPLSMFGTDGIFLITKRFAGFVNIPIVALFAVGLFNKTVSGLAARIALLVRSTLFQYCLGVQCENQFLVCDGWIIRIWCCFHVDSRSILKTWTLCGKYHQ